MKLLTVGVGAGDCCGGGVLVHDSGTCWRDAGRRRHHCAVIDGIVCGLD